MFPYSLTPDHSWPQGPQARLAPGRTGYGKEAGFGIRRGPGTVRGRTCMLSAMAWATDTGGPGDPPGPLPHTPASCPPGWRRSGGQPTERADCSLL